MPISVKEVKSGSDLKKFIDFPHDLYKDDPYYVPELFIAQKDLLKSSKNPFFEHSKMSKFLAYRDGKIVGRVAAIRNNNHIEYTGENTGFFGFFDCINDVEVSNTLFDRVKKWHIDEKLTSISGPANPSTNDSVGMLIDGFYDTPCIQTTYNFAYYPKLVEAYGFKKKMDLFAYEITTIDASQRSIDIAERLEVRLKKRGISIRNLSIKNWDEEADKVLTVYRKAWESNWGFVPPTDAEFYHGVKDMKMILDENFAYIAEHEGKPVGIVVALPDINQLQRHIKRGRLFPFGWYKLMFQKKWIYRVRIITLGVIPEFRKMGLEAIFYSKMILNARKKGLLNGEASWILENNEMMNLGLERLNAHKTKTYRIYHLPLS